MKHHDIRITLVFRVNPKSTFFQRWILSINQRWQIDVESTWIWRWPTSRRYFYIYQRWINVECLIGETPGNFVMMLVVVVLLHQKIFMFHFSFFTHCFLTLSPCLSLWAFFYFVLSLELITDWFATLSSWHFVGFLFYHDCYGFERAFYTPRRFSSCTFYAAQIRVATHHLRSSFMPALIDLIFSASACFWNADVVFTNTFVFSTVLVSHKV